MDFLERIGYTGEGKRLRKRFSHYSQSLSRVNPYFIKASAREPCLGVMIENKYRENAGTCEAVGGSYRKPADRIACQSGCG